MSTRQVQNVASLVSTVKSLDGTAAVPKEDSKSDSLVARSTHYLKGYNPKEVIANCDALSELACSTICLTLSQSFWESKHDPNTPIALWIGHVRVAANELLTINELLTDWQVANCLVAGLDSSWSAVKDSIIYTAQDMSLDNTIGALEAHEAGAVSTVKLGGYELGSFDDGDKVDVVYE
ncbi:hypothetical protein PGT21_027277 [Puccinia graminis f. sp. tritici]|uniref:Uncharacterized protein n=1 Tax=Puccinia graminis f. sp. tritici TaxID=56615 RepID=A0A5B0P9M2_PUCGR|nr:hypothetical protein PGT21_027277 [Puccinia graminis f. sp. tritici]